MSFRNIFFAFLIFIFTLFFSLTKSFAQLPDFSIATTYQINDPLLEDGDIVSLKNYRDATRSAILARSETAYDETMHGVYLKNPKMVYRTPGNNYPVSRTGEIDVNVTTLNGEIKVGDYISSSVIPGKGQKAVEFTGYMLGVALAPFGNKSGTEIVFEKKTYRTGKVKVAIGIGPASPSVIKAAGGFFGTLRSVSSSFAYNLANSRQAERIIRILLAVIVAVTSIALSIHFFGKNVTKGIESIGRNPLAKVAIQSMIIVNIVLISAIAIGGIIIALVIISL